MNNAFDLFRVRLATRLFELADNAASHTRLALEQRIAASYKRAARRAGTLNALATRETGMLIEQGHARVKLLKQASGDAQRAARDAYRAYQMAEQALDDLILSR